MSAVGGDPDHTVDVSAITTASRSIQIHGDPGPLQWNRRKGRQSNRHCHRRLPVCPPIVHSCVISPKEHRGDIPFPLYGQRRPFEAAIKQQEDDLRIAIAVCNLNKITTIVAHADAASRRRTREEVRPRWQVPHQWRMAYATMFQEP
jgi:hypothetical protein